MKPSTRQPSAARPAPAPVPVVRPKTIGASWRRREEVAAAAPDEGLGAAYAALIGARAFGYLSSAGSTASGAPIKSYFSSASVAAANQGERSWEAQWQQNLREAPFVGSSVDSTLGPVERADAITADVARSAGLQAQGVRDNADILERIYQRHLKTEKRVDAAERTVGRIMTAKMDEDRPAVVAAFWGALENNWRALANALSKAESGILRAARERARNDR